MIGQVDSFTSSTDFPPSFHTWPVYVHIKVRENKTRLLAWDEFDWEEEKSQVCELPVHLLNSKDQEIKLDASFYHAYMYYARMASLSPNVHLSCEYLSLLPFYCTMAPI